MPAPDPEAISMGDTSPGKISLLADMSFVLNRKARMARANAIFVNLRRGGWTCRWCAEPVPLHKRADAQFCSEGCRKRSARHRRLCRSES